MSVEIIDTLVPKNDGDFPVVEAKDVAVNEQRLPEVLDGLASAESVEAVAQELTNKADKSELAEAERVIALKADKAETEEKTTGLQNQINNIVSPVTQDAEVQNLRIDSYGNSHPTAKARVDAEIIELNNSLDELSKTILLPYNLHDINDSRIKANGYYNANGQFITSTGYYVSEPIFVIGGVEYSVTHPESLGNNSVIVNVDDSNNIISHFSGVVSNKVVKFTPQKSGLISVNLGGASDYKNIVLSVSEAYVPNLEHKNILTIFNELSQADDDTNAKISSISNITRFSAKDGVKFDNFYIDNSGKILPSTNDDTRIVYFNCKPNTKYKVSKISSNAFKVSYSSVVPSANIQSSGLVNNASATQIEIETDSTAKYLLLYYSYNDRYPENVYNSITVNNIDDSAIDIYSRRKIVELADNVNEHFTMLNLFNKDDVRNISNKYISAAGTIANANNYHISHPIPVKNGHIYYWKAYELGTNNKVFYGKDAEHIESTTEANVNNGLFSFNCIKDGTIIINLGTSPLSSFMVNPDEYSLAYYPYKTYLSDSISLENKKSEILEMLPKDNELNGKKIALNGDSICYGAGYVGGYGKILSDTYGMNVNNIAVSGATIRKVSGKHCISETINNMPSDYDYYIFEGGVNDCANGFTIGDISTDYPVKGESDTLNTATIIGAFEYACRDLVTIFDGKKVGFIFVHGIFGKDSQLRLTWSEIKEKMQKSLRKWGVPYIDLENEIPPFNCIDSLKITYTNNGDGWHPNQNGYEKYYAPKIAAWLKTL